MKNLIKSFSKLKYTFSLGSIKMFFAGVKTILLEHSRRVLNVFGELKRHLGFRFKSIKRYFFPEKKAHFRINLIIKVPSDIFDKDPKNVSIEDLKITFINHPKKSPIRTEMMSHALKNMNLFWFMEILRIDLLSFSRSTFNVWLNSVKIEVGRPTSLDCNKELKHLNFFSYIYLFGFHNTFIFNIYKRFYRPFVYKVYLFKSNFGKASLTLRKKRRVSKILLRKLRKKLIH